jgi:hypothetical protein
MVFLWGAVLFIFLFTVPKQEKPEEKVWRELEESINKESEQRVDEKKRLKIKDVDWDKLDNAKKNATSSFKNR